VVLAPVTTLGRLRCCSAWPNFDARTAEAGWDCHQCGASLVPAMMTPHRATPPHGVLYSCLLFVVCPDPTSERLALAELTPTNGFRCAFSCLGLAVWREQPLHDGAARYWRPNACGRLRWEASWPKPALPLGSRLRCGYGGTAVTASWPVSVRLLMWTHCAEGSASHMLKGVGSTRVGYGPTVKQVLAEIPEIPP
jgi:hypothetical protein